MDAHANESLSRALHEEKPSAETKFCGQCGPKILCCCLATVKAPLNCVPCARSKQRNHIYAEIPVSGDWDLRSFVMRIGCTCDKCMATELEKDDTRTIGFASLEESVQEWNQMQAEIAVRGTSL